MKTNGKSVKSSASLEPSSDSSEQPARTVARLRIGRLVGIILPLGLGTCGLGSAQSTISCIHRFVYAGNAGWIDFRPSAADGVVVEEFFLAGNAYAANFGWVDFGSGSPANGHAYSNSSASDFGVNLSPEGLLTGCAYAANCGWITFEQTYGKARLNYLTGKFTGHAYSANLGWISLDTPESDLVATAISSPDTDADGIADAWEMLHFSNLTAAGINPETDADGDGASDLSEFTAGTVPKDPASLLRILSCNFSPGLLSASIIFTTAPNRLYRLEHGDDLQTPWTDSGLGIFAPDTGTQTSRSISLPGGAAQFLRAAAVRPLQP